MSRRRCSPRAGNARPGVRASFLARLTKDQPEIDWPASSTVGDLLRREGLTQPRAARSRDPRPKQPIIEPTAPNESRAADFKGWFRTAD